MGGQKTNMAAMSPFLKSNRKEMGIHVGHPKLSLCTKFSRNPVGVVRVTAPSVFTSKMAIRHQAAILNEIKNLFDVHNPQTIPDLGVKFQTI